MQSHSAKPKAELRHRCYYFSLHIIKFLDTLPDKRLFWVIADQLLRSATSIGANVVEARGSSSKRDFARFFEIALKSANETKYWLALLRDSGKIDAKQTEKLLIEADEIAKMLGASIITLKGRR